MPQMTDTITAKPRTNKGKGAARKHRHNNELPAVAYGPKIDTTFLTLDPRTFGMQRSQFGLSHIYDVALDGGQKFKALIREIQIDPVSQGMVHVDLYALDMSKPIRIEVVLELEGKPAGLLEGGILQQVMRKIMVECLPAEIPTKLTADVSPLKLGESLHLSAIKLPKGVKFVSQADDAVATMVAPEEEIAAPVAAAAEGAAAEGAAAAAPAAGKEGEKAAAGDKAAAGKEGGKK